MTVRNKHPDISLASRDKGAFLACAACPPQVSRGFYLLFRNPWLEGVPYSYEQPVDTEPQGTPWQALEHGAPPPSGMSS